jgi:hypothetical protein
VRKIAIRADLLLRVNLVTVGIHQLLAFATSLPSMKTIQELSPETRKIPFLGTVFAIVTKATKQKKHKKSAYTHIDCEHLNSN